MSITVRFTAICALCAGAALALAQPVPPIWPNHPAIDVDTSQQGEGLYSFGDDLIQFFLIEGIEDDYSFELADPAGNGWIPWTVQVLLNDGDGTYVPVEFATVHSYRVRPDGVLPTASSQDTIEEITPLAIHFAGQVKCFTVGSVKCCYSYYERANGDYRVTVYIWHKNEETGNWDLKLYLDTGWLEKPEASPPPTIETVVAEIGAFILEVAPAAESEARARLMDVYQQFVQNLAAVLDELGPPDAEAAEQAVD